MSILDKMMRIAGRGTDGLAKAIKTDTEGTLLTKLVADDGNGNPVELASVQRPDGRWVLLTVDSAPFTWSETLYTGTKSITTDAIAIGLSQPCKEVTVQADPDNTGNILIGNSSNQCISLVPGMMIDVTVDNVGKIYAKSKSGTATVNWIARD